MLEFVTGGTSYVRITEEDAIKNILDGPYGNTYDLGEQGREDALYDFIQIHHAYKVQDCRDCKWIILEYCDECSE